MGAGNGGERRELRCVDGLAGKTEREEQRGLGILADLTAAGVDDGVDDKVEMRCAEVLVVCEDCRGTPE